MSRTRRIGVLGGTFDPIHLGHLDVAAAARAALGLDEILLVPSRVPPHRPVAPIASGYHRFAMAGLALVDQPICRVSDLELSASGPSYTAVTLDTLARTEGPPSQLFFITGADAFAEIATWHAYPDVLDKSHFIVVSRPGHQASDLPRQLGELASRMRVPPTPVSEELGPGTAVWLVDAETRDISSSEVRGRLASERPVDQLLPPLVSRYIQRHRLYQGDAVGEPFA